MPEPPIGTDTVTLDDIVRVYPEPIDIIPVPVGFVMFVTRV